ncbi:MAG: prepilin-type N-terminal cleavage/methylation domain-containing protein [Pirellulales bacterium]
MRHTRFSSGRQVSSARQARRGAANHRRRGLTLIELLIVITVMLAVTALTIPVMAPALKGRRVREATRMIDVFVNGARNRATLTGRPVGVIFERVPGLPEASATLAYAEVPPPYAGDTTISTIVIEIDPMTGDLQTSFPQADSGWIGMLKPGDVLKLNYQGHLYRIDGPSESYTDSNGNGRYDVGEAYTDSNGNGQYDYLLQPWTYTNLTGGNLPLAPSPGLPFQIIRQPVRSSGDSLQLPPSIVVDLSWSGFSMAQPNTSGAPFDTWRFAPNVAAYPQATNPAGDPTPVIVMFNPTGSVFGVYCWSNLPFNPTPPPAPFWGPQAPLAPLHFLVGRRENVPFNADALGPDNAWGAAGVDDDNNTVTDDIWEAGWSGSDDRVPGFNLQDLTSLWVSINPQTGLITSAENARMSPGAGPFTALARMRQVRDIALESQAMGGR